MDRIRRLAAFWNWLPAFRAVAEVEHLPSAAEQFHVSASALSRSVKQLEEHLSVSLFERDGRLVLNDNGRELLGTIRRAMRIIDEGIERVTSPEFSGQIRIASPGSFASILLVPATAPLVRAHPKLIPVVSAMSASSANAELHAGRIDVAVLDDPIPEAGLRVERLIELTYGVYCGRGHPLYDRPDPTSEQLLQHAFVAALVGQNDHWPPDVPRIIASRFEVLHHGLDLCAAGSFLAILPDRIAATRGEFLRRLPFQALAPTTVYAVFRESLGHRSKVDALLDAIRATAVDTIAN